MTWLKGPRAFGYVLAVLMLIFAARFEGLRGLFLAGAAVATLLALVFPQSLDLVYRAWMKVGLVLGAVVTPLLMTVIFVLVVTPIAVILRLLGKDVLALRRSKAGSHWKDRAVATTSFHKQF